MADLLNNVPQVGSVTWIGVRRERRGPVEPRERAQLIPGVGVAGDHRSVGRTPDPTASRQLTLLQAEHLPVIASLAGVDEVLPQWLRRNVLVRGINLLALRDRTFTMGGVRIEGTGLCHPCSRMEENLGPGGYNAMRGHGGITARILSPGWIRVGDEVRLGPDDAVPDDAAPPANDA